LVVLFALCFLLMPFSVFGLKGRLETIEARLDEIQGEIRNLVLRLPEPGRTEYEPAELSRRRWTEPESRPPIPPRAVAERPHDRPLADRPPPPPSRRIEPTRRAEPRFDPS
jgi:hypothetical protein